MKRAHDQVAEEPSHCYDPSVVVWKCVAELAAQRRDAKSFWRVVSSVPKIGRASIACKSNSNREYRYWTLYFHRVRVECFRKYSFDMSKGTHYCVTQRWYRRRQLHRRGAPAVVMHRLLDPIRIDEEWYEDGKLHRVGGPAYVCDGVVKKWYCRGKLHRDGDRPAVEGAHPLDREWWVHGTLTSYTSWGVRCPCMRTYNPCY